jgi:hypothetical protein
MGAADAAAVQGTSTSTAGGDLRNPTRRNPSSPSSQALTDTRSPSSPSLVTRLCPMAASGGRRGEGAGEEVGGDGGG